MTRKKFIKKFMGLGFSRNGATAFAYVAIHVFGSYKKAYESYIRNFNNTFFGIQIYNGEGLKYDKKEVH